jgi:phage shock protein E
VKTIPNWSRFFLLLALVVLPKAASAQNTAAPVGKRVEVSGGAYWDITVPQLQTMLEHKDFPLINTHVPFEGDLPQTDRSIAFDKITEHLDQLPTDKNAPIVLYCRSGRMSTEAATALAAKGYTKVYSLVGGFNAWKAAGLAMKP